MKCRYCNVALSPLRSLTDGEFCCDEHRTTFFQEKVAGLVAAPAAPPENPAENPLVSLHSAVIGPLAELKHEFLAHHQLPSKPPTPAPEPEEQPGQVAEAVAEPEPLPPAARDQLLPLKFAPAPADPQAAVVRGAENTPVFEGSPQLPPLRVRLLAVLEDETAAPELLGTSGESPLPDPVPRLPGRTNWIVRTWRNSPRDLRIITLVVPILLTIALGPSVPKLRVPGVSGGQVQAAVAERFKTIHQSILNRAAVAFADDFRSGLDAWDSRSNLTTSWSYDATGFVQPGPLAVFKPTVDLSDYRFEFLGEIDQRGLGCAFRAPDLDNYYAVKFVIVRPGPLPLVHLVRYAVIHGKEGPRVEKPLPFTTRADMLYRVLVDVRGNDFTILAQGQVVDFWSDQRLKKGGVGFFCGRGEKARLRWVEVSHQYDALGRLCAYLAPYGIESRNGTWN